MTKKRAHLSFDDESIDLEEITVAIPKQRPNMKQRQQIDHDAEKLGFVSREVVKRRGRKRSPYVIQKNIKMRFGMPELLADLTQEISSGSEQETLELAIVALAQKHQMSTIVKKYEDLIKDS